MALILQSTTCGSSSNSEKSRRKERPKKFGTQSFYRSRRRAIIPTTATTVFGELGDLDTVLTAALVVKVR